MFDWLSSTSNSSDGPLTVSVLILRLVIAALFGGGVAVLYLFSHGREKEDSRPIMATLVLLSVLIAMVSMVIGNSVARAFSLVGALSIVRFRTVVEDTRDTAFVIFAVIVGMASGTGLLLVPVVGMPIVGVAAIVLSHWPNSAKALANGKCRLHIRVALGLNPNTLLATTLDRHLDSVQIESTGTARQGASLDLVYVARLRKGASQLDLISELNHVEGVQSAEIKLS